MVNRRTTEMKTERDTRICSTLNMKPSNYEQSSVFSSKINAQCKGGDFHSRQVVKHIEHDCWNTSGRTRARRLGRKWEHEWSKKVWKLLTFQHYLRTKTNIMEADNSMLRSGVRIKGEQKRRMVGKQSRGGAAKSGRQKQWKKFRERSGNSSISEVINAVLTRVCTYRPRGRSLAAGTKVS